jgi:hypothetical protein
MEPPSEWLTDHRSMPGIKLCMCWVYAKLLAALQAAEVIINISSLPSTYT